ncbi:Flp family type IVb pilin [Pseudomonas neuropathica]|mgnify:CR=1 FL=1|jgi:pilus assembly protein Flp/PilA|uniref:Flp family type IVb pilin n=1 Tax=Pseudomonas TaxID=286 RepID=UPI0008B88090|nr:MULTISPECIES: Flp family type IVb pilin [Pseudomonas]PIF51007.1 pilus assembly protein Flp/PilA [Pseudomonas sp. 29]TKJ84902.1 Flp family type IVb pilin [Pseudomonas koreensis]SEN33477.1 pilus assembly protein Flp/PilA [Pseudomonas sp. ok266]
MLFEYLMIRARSFLADDDAASAIEYAIVVAMVAVVVIVFVTPVGGRVLIMFDNLLVALGGSTVQTPPATP